MNVLNRLSTGNELTDSSLSIRELTMDELKFVSGGGEDVPPTCSGGEPCFPPGGGE